MTSIDFLNKRCFPPSSWGYKYCVHTMCEIKEQTLGFFLSIGEVISGSGYTKNKWLFHAYLFVGTLQI